ncbi:hypothetical protein [Maribacter halichondriae]|uniref:hypothetical protein n=1 Tax=Maribacter halichondriae TaxID=2980554 RepID=UPI0023581BC4|nr:hypothetical protein [Maribacter sp. Hal144]
MKIGRFDCLTELYTTNRDLTAYNAPPGMYKVRFKVGDFSQDRNFEIKIDPRIVNSIENAAAAYVERNEISKSIYEGATEMAKGVRNLRMIKQQLETVMDLASNDKVKQEGKVLDETLDKWISEILQKEMRTYQSNYMFEARLLIKFKDFLDNIGKGNLPITQGVRDVTQDYLQQWDVLKRSLEQIKNTDIATYNTLLKSNGLPELYWPK